MTTIEMSTAPSVPLATGGPATSATSATPSRGRRVLNRLVGLVLGLAFPTGILSWVFGFDPIKKQINGRLWCAGADNVDLVVKVKSNANKMNISDTLVCSKNGAVYRTVGDLRMWPTSIGVAFAISLALICILAMTLMTYSKLRRRVSAG